MDAHKPTRAARIEGLVRGMLGLLLLAAVAWALASGDGDRQGLFSVGGLPG
jgi:hypothetical protein